MVLPEILGHDPEAAQNFVRAMGGSVKVVDREYDALDGADALILLTEWRSYRAPNFAEIRKRLRSEAGKAPLVIDARIKAHHAPPLVEDPAVTRRVERLGVRGASLHGIL